MHVLIMMLLGGGFTPGASASPLTTKGDIYTYSTTNTRKAVGSDGQCLKALASDATGLEWGSCASGGGLTYAEVAAAVMGGF